MYFAGSQSLSRKQMFSVKAFPEFFFQKLFAMLSLIFFYISFNIFLSYLPSLIFTQLFLPNNIHQRLCSVLSKNQKQTNLKEETFFYVKIWEDTIQYVQECEVAIHISHAVRNHRGEVMLVYSSFSLFFF